MTKRKFSASLAIVLALVMLMAVAGVAAVTGGYVGWDGVYHSYDESTKIDPPEDYDYDAANPYHDILSTIPRGEYWAVTKDGEVVDGARSYQPAYDAEEFARMIEGTALPMPVLPEGYVYFAASFLTEPEETPYSETTLDDGAVLSKYKTKEPVPGEVTNYNYDFCKPNGGNLHSISAEIVPAQDWLIDDGPVVYLSGDEEVEAVQVEGYEYGLYYVDPTGFAQLKLLQPMGDEMLIIYVHAFEDLPKEAVLNLFNPEGNIDLTNHETESVRPNYSEVLHDIPEGEYWEIDCADIEGHIVSKSNDPAVEDFDALAKLTKLPVPVLPEGCKIDSLYAMPAIEDDFYEEITLEDGSILRKHHLAEVVEGELEYYRFIIENAAGCSIACEVFTEAAAQNRGETIEPSKFTGAEELTVPGFDSALYDAKAFENDTAHLLMTKGDVSILFTVWDDVPVEELIALFPAE